MNLMGLTFDAASHKYFVGGREVPSVTTILNAAGLTDFSMVSEEVLEMARVRGTHVHLICELYDANNLDEDSLDDGGKEYLKAWKRFKKDYGITDFLLSECAMHSKKYGYAGRSDRFAKLKKNRGQQVTVIDIKTGTPSKATGPQMAAYAQMYRELYKLPQGLHIDRIEVLLEPNKYKVIEHKDARDWSIFLSCLNIYNYKKGMK
jgi:hypothetical protein